MFDTVLIANRGEIAVRAIRTLKRLGVKSVAVYSDADRNAQHVRDADLAIALGGDKPADSYLRVDKILAAAAETGAQAIYPGYGFLSESADFAEACSAAGIAFVGPTPAQIREFGLKHRARELAAEWRGKRLLITGAGVLEYLPFAALRTADHALLAARHEIVTIPSASVLATIRRETAQRAAAAKPLAILADPVFSADDPRLARTSAAPAPTPSDNAASRAALGNRSRRRASWTADAARWRAAIHGG